MARVIYAVVAVLTVHVIAATQLACPSDPNCKCTSSLVLDLNCNINGSTVKINFLPNTYLSIKCENTTTIDYSKLPKCANDNDSVKSVSFKDCPLPSSSFKGVMSNLGVSKTMALIYQNAKNLSGYFDRQHFAGLQDLTKLLLSINGITRLPNNLFLDINKLTWLNIRSNTINLSEELFEPLERLETLEISHNHMTNISSNLFSHLSFLRKLSLWQSNVTWFSKDLFSGVDVLEELDLSSNGLNELPGTIFKPLRKLKKLTLFSNKFSTLPLNLFNNNTKLEIVVILNNNVKLKELPTSLFGNLANLKEIYIQKCGVEIVPYDTFANSTRITNISLAYNDIEQLPESIFNDQINLLDLDLSYNNLKELEPKIFSSLVKLERLNLCHNSLKQICGITFSPLLSLMYLNMEHNKLSTISAEMFINNRQRMTISLAYNNLDFITNVNESGSIASYLYSPFKNTYNLRLLNLSHNKFVATPADWWHNGHENLDLRYNKIRYLWNPNRPTDCMNDTFFKRPINLWVSHNPLNCRCRDNKFFDLFARSRSQIIDEDELTNCETKLSCQIKVAFLVFSILCVVASYMFYLVTVVVKKAKQRAYIESSVSRFSEGYECFDVVLRFSEADKDFVDKILIPELNHYKSMKLRLQITKNPDSNDNFINDSAPNDCMHFQWHGITIVLVTPNFVLTACRSEDKKSVGEILDERNTVYIYANIGPNNTMYEELEPIRDKGTSFVWNTKKFWPELLAGMIRIDESIKLVQARLDTKDPAIFNNAKTKSSDISFFTLSDLSPKVNDMEAKTDIPA